VAGWQGAWWRASDSTARAAPAPLPADADARQRFLQWQEAELEEVAGAVEREDEARRGCFVFSNRARSPPSRDPWTEEEPQV
jgi:hypothetical protein